MIKARKQQQRKTQHMQRTHATSTASFFRAWLLIVWRSSVRLALVRCGFGDPPPTRAPGCAAPRARDPPLALYASGGS